MSNHQTTDLPIEVLEELDNECSASLKTALDNYKNLVELIDELMERKLLIADHYALKKSELPIDPAYLLTPVCYVNDVETESYKQFVDWLAKFNLTTNGIYTKINQRVVSVKFKQNDQTYNDKQIEGLKYILQFLNPINDTNGIVTGHKLEGSKPINVLTNEQGITYDAFIREDNTVVLQQTYYGDPDYKMIGQFDDAMQYIIKHHCCK